MIKRLIFLVFSFAAIFQQTNAQGDPGFLKTFNVGGSFSTGLYANWTIAANEAIKDFVLEKSENGCDFTTVVMLHATQKRGTESYEYNEPTIAANKLMYRLKMLSKGQNIYYSKIITFQPRTANINRLKVVGNPAIDKLTLSFNTRSNQILDLQIFSITGIQVVSQKITASANNLVSVSLGSSFIPGIYVVQLNDGVEIQTVNFVKQ